MLPSVIGSPGGCFAFAMSQPIRRTSRELYFKPAPRLFLSLHLTLGPESGAGC
jgi:hypothetical protein